jgi:hypothetical protein
MLAQATETQQTAIRLIGLDFACDAIRVWLRADGEPTQVASKTGPFAEGDNATLHFTAPEAGTYDVAVKADVSTGDTRTLFQDTNAFRSNPDFGA